MFRRPTRKAREVALRKTQNSATKYSGGVDKRPDESPTTFDPMRAICAVAARTLSKQAKRQRIKFTIEGRKLTIEIGSSL